MRWTASAPNTVVAYCGCQRSQSGEPSMKEVIAVGLDIAKHVFQVHGVDQKGDTVLRRKLRRSEIISFFDHLPPCLIGVTDVPSKRSDPVTQANDDYPSGCHQACLLSRASAGKECKRSHQLVENQCCCRKGSHDWFGWLLLKSPWALLGRAGLEIRLRRQCSERPHIANFIREWANSRNFIRTILL